MFALNNLVEKVASIENALKTFKLDLVFSAFINIVLICVLFKLTDVLINKLKKHYNSSDNIKLSSHLIPILEKIIKFLIVIMLLASFVTMLAACGGTQNGDGSKDDGTTDVTPGDDTQNDGDTEKQCRSIRNA